MIEAETSIEFPLKTREAQQNGIEQGKACGSPVSALIRSFSFMTGRAKTPRICNFGVLHLRKPKRLFLGAFSLMRVYAKANVS
jgi:hypothetical protein